MNHEHQFIMDPNPVRLPVGPEPEHTVVYQFVCECGAVEIWPPENFALCRGDYREAFVQNLAAVRRWLNDAE